MIVLELPAPLSVNRTRKIDWANYHKVKQWRDQADALFLTQKRKLGPPIIGQYEAVVTLRDGSRIDADNTLKLLLDAVRRFGLVSSDSPKFLRRLVVEFGEVAGCRITLNPLDNNSAT